jgi:hypothetical protein
VDQVDLLPADLSQLLIPETSVQGAKFGMGSVMRYKELGPISHDQLQRFLAEGVASHHPFTLMDHAHFRSDFLSTSDGPRS